MTSNVLGNAFRSIIGKLFLISGLMLIAIISAYFLLVRSDGHSPSFVDPTQLKLLVDSSIVAAGASSNQPTVLRAFENAATSRLIALSFSDTPTITSSSEFSPPLLKLIKGLEKNGNTVYAQESSITPEELLAPMSLPGSPVYYSPIPVGGPNTPQVSDNFPIDLNGGITVPSPLLFTKSVELSLQYEDGHWINLQYNGAPETVVSKQEWYFLIALPVAILALIATAYSTVCKPLRALTSQFPRAIDNRVLLPESDSLEIGAFASAANCMILRIAQDREEQNVMLNAISHDLHTPIASLRIRSEFIADKKLKGEIQNTLSNIEEMTQSVLEGARGGAVDEPISQVELSSLIEAVCDDFSAFSDRIHLKSLTYVVSKGRPTELRRMLQNLIDNAFKYAEQVSVSLEMSDHNHALITIDDDGPGIPEHQIQKVKTPFFRLEESRNQETGGFGLGLTIANAISLRNNGELTIENLPSKGLRVTIKLPLAERA